MKTFAEMLPTATAEMREFVEAYDRDLGAWLAVTTTSRPHPLEQMRAEPPVKEPESVEAVIVQWSDGTKSARIIGETGLQVADRVRETKLED